MAGFIIFLAYVLICCVFLGLLHWGLQSTSLPQPIKVAIIIVVVAIGVIYFVQSGYLTNLPRG